MDSRTRNIRRQNLKIMIEAWYKFKLLPARLFCKERNNDAVCDSLAPDLSRSIIPLESSVGLAVLELQAAPGHLTRNLKSASGSLRLTFLFWASEQSTISYYMLLFLRVSLFRLGFPRKKKSLPNGSCELPVYRLK